MSGRAVPPKEHPALAPLLDVLAVNHDPAAPVFDFADIGITADWRETLPVLAAGLRRAGVGRTGRQPCPVGR